MKAVHKRIFAAGLSLLLFATAPAMMRGQVVTGEIDGTVRDASGAAVPSATITIQSETQSGLERQVHTDAQGQFVAPLLTTGAYSVKIEAPSFQSQTVTHVVVHLDQPVNLPVKLKAGEVSSTITVSEDVLAPQLETAAAGTILDGTQVRELSLSSRNYQQLLTLQPGVVTTVPGTIDRGIINPTGGSNAANFSVNGQRVSQNGYFLDGVDMVGHGASQQSQFFPSLDSIQEISLLRNTFGAQYGGEGSAVINMTTRSGSGEFHGGAYGFFRSQIFNANNYFNNLAGIKRPSTRYADFGYQVGGFVPIRGDHRRTTFFVGQEFLREETPTTLTDSNIPTAAELTGVFPVAVCTQYGAVGTPTAGQCQTTSTTITNINTTAQEYIKDILNKIPTGSATNTLTFSTASYDNETQTFLRADHTFNDKFSVFFRYIHEPFTQTVPFGLYGTSGVPNVGTSALRNGSTNYMGHATYVINARTVLEGGYAQAIPFNNATPTGLISSLVSKDINPILPYHSSLTQVPNFSINGLAFGATGPYYNPGSYLIMFANLTHTMGRHTLRTGFNFEDMHAGGNSGGNNTGNFAFTAGQLPAGVNAFQQSFANFLLGQAASFTQLSVDAVAWIHMNLYEAYVQDDFKLSPRLTLNAGVRYTLMGQPVDDVYNGHQFFPLVSFDADTYNPANAPALTSAGQICTASPCYGGATPNSTTYNALNGVIQGGSTSPYGSKVDSQPNLTFAPRVGFAYDVFGNGKTSLRGGYGLYYIQTLLGNWQNMVFQDPPNVRNITINTTSSNSNGISFDNPGSGVIIANVPLALYGAAPHAAVPYVEDYSLDLQHELAKDLLLDIGYFGNQARHQIGEEDFNQPAQGAFATSGLFGTPPVVTAANSANLNVLRPYRGYGPINIVTPRFIANYNSLQTSITKKFQRGSQITADYTWSKAMTNSQSDRSNGPANINNLAAEYGPTLYSRKSVFSANFVYFLPFYRDQQGVIGHALGGWEFSGIISAASGLPATVTTSGVDPAGLGLLAAGVVGPSNRPDKLSNPNTGAPHTRLAWFNTASFANVPAGQYRPGNESVGSVVAPGYQDWDLSAFRNIRIWHETNLQLRGEAFNTFNHTNFVGLSTVRTASNFGQVTSAASARILQLGAKLTF